MSTDELRAGIEAIISARHSGDFAPLIPKLQALVAQAEADE